jgi:hypothetical protein
MPLFSVNSHHARIGEAHRLYALVVGVSSLHQLSNDAAA